MLKTTLRMFLVQLQFKAQFRLKARPLNLANVKVSILYVKMAIQMALNSTPFNIQTNKR